MRRLGSLECSLQGEGKGFCLVVIENDLYRLEVTGGRAKADGDATRPNEVGLLSLLPISCDNNAAVLLGCTPEQGRTVYRKEMQGRRTGSSPTMLGTNKKTFSLVLGRPVGPRPVDCTVDIRGRQGGW